MLAALHVCAHAADAFPDPLRLEQALAYVDAPHPDTERRLAALDLARAQRESVQARQGVRAYADITPQTVNPATAAHSDFVDDSHAGIVVSKELYDFGRTRADLHASDLAVTGREQALLDARRAHRLLITARFFDVLLADLRYAADNEAMAYRYVEYDHARDRHKLGQLSDVDLLRLQSEYEEAHVRRSRSQSARTRARLRLARALGRPDVLPKQVVAPSLPDLDRPTPDYETVWKAVEAGNSQLAALRADTESARARVVAAGVRSRPVLSADAGVARYRREFVSRDDARATLNLRIPLYNGAEDRSAAAIARAQLRGEEARLAAAESELRQASMDLVQEIDDLKVARQAAGVRSRYRDLDLDRSRALYELEVRADLGEAMAKETEAQFLAAQADYRLALAFARLDALTGDLLNPTLTPAKP